MGLYREQSEFVVQRVDRKTGLSIPEEFFLRRERSRAVPGRRYLEVGVGEGTLFQLFAGSGSIVCESSRGHIPRWAGSLGDSTKLSEVASRWPS